MKDIPPHLRISEEIQKTGTPSLVEVLREEGIEAVRYVLSEMRPAGTGATALPLGVIGQPKIRADRLADGGPYRQYIPAGHCDVSRAVG